MSEALPLLDAANQVQRLASDPLASVFVSASAGSGKTKLLIDRLLRLMLPLPHEDGRDGRVRLLAGSDPSRIVCLTFTKAAAAEMANRLNEQLGTWVAMSDDALNESLAKLDLPPLPEMRRAARALFIKVLDLPGGMRIETIHAFCQSLLRRFPLEASISPHFTLIEPSDAQRFLDQAIEDTIAQFEKESSSADILRPLSEELEFSALTAIIKKIYFELRKSQEQYDTSLRDPRDIQKLYRTLLNLGPLSRASFADERCCCPNAQALRSGLRAALDIATSKQREHIEGMLAWLACEASERDPAVWRAALFTKAGKLRALKAFLPERYLKEHSTLVDMISREAARLEAIDVIENRYKLAFVNAALFSLTNPTKERFQRAKLRVGGVEYHDLIATTRELFARAGSGWVLYKLDGGIDHLLLDEVQDTSAQQWEIAAALTDEFFSGESARSRDLRPRTIFAVGDYKQSIFGFQGAEPKAFFRARRRFAERVTRARLIWRTPELDVSFRSVEPILQLVDAVFQNPESASGLIEQGQTAPPCHHSARVHEGGRVELWPCVPRRKKLNDADQWDIEGQNVVEEPPQQKLANYLAGWIKRQIGSPPLEGQAPLRARDVLVLVSKRSAFVQQLVRALKTRGVEVATLISMALLDQPVVQDLIALCDVLLLPQDDLMLARVLTSPLGGLDDVSLMNLSLNRAQESLWDTLKARHTENVSWSMAWQMLSALFERIDFASPYQILSDALGRHGASARIFQRLGPEVADSIDDLLAACLKFEERHPSSMQNFLQWLRDNDGAEKRESDAAHDAVRIMTVHTAKGLQARLTILPDTTSSPISKNDDLFWMETAQGALPLWRFRKQDYGREVDEIVKAQFDDVHDERNRLLYVALTRAQDWLVICGWEPNASLPEACWYERCRRGFDAIQAPNVVFDGDWFGKKRIVEVSHKAPPTKDDVRQPDEVQAMPKWFGQAPDWRAVYAPMEPRLTRPLAPSRLTQLDTALLPPARSPLIAASLSVTGRERALRYGIEVHRLLQILPGYPAHNRRALVWARLRSIDPELDKNVLCERVDRLINIMENPDLAPVFGPESFAEQTITGVIGQNVIIGQVDRFCVSKGVVHLCDFKTNLNPPKDPRDVSRVYLRQMAAYAAVLRQVYPGARLKCCLVWTETPALTFLDEVVLRQYEPGGS